MIQPWTMQADGFLGRWGLRTRAQRAWALYDWANSAYATVIMAAVLPPFFSVYYASGLAPRQATRVYALLVTAALLATAFLSPLLGAVADYRRAKKKMLAFFTGAGSLAVALLFFVEQGAWLRAGLLTAAGAVAFGLALVFYEGLLPSLADEEEVDRVSAAGYALGYAGGGLLLAIETAWLLWPERFGMRDSVTATRYAILAVALWWPLFSIPLLLKVPEPIGALGSRAARSGHVLATAWRELQGTFREIRAYRDLFVFLMAFWLYNDGMGTIIKMAAIFGAEVGIALHHLVLALLLTQFVAFPCAFLFGRLGARVGPRNGIYLALAVYMVVAFCGFFLARTWQFYALAALVGTVQGGAQALSRSLFVRLVPRTRAGEFFGFYAVSSKLATLFGPLLFALVGYLTGTSRLAVLSMVAFFAGGMLLLRKVDVARGEAHARAVDAAAQAAS